MNRTNLLRWATAFSPLVAAVLCAPPAMASPWTLPQHELVLDLSHDFQVATEEFLPDGTRQPFPLAGTFRSHNSRFGARYGFTDRFEGAASFNVALVTYQADPLILDDFPDGATSSELTESILNFSSNRFGVGDVRLYGRYSLIQEGLVRVTSETTAKLPTGYDAPEGTFRTRSDGTTEIVGQATLGDGQTDLTQSLLFGAFIAPTRTFVRLDTGFRLRFGAPGHQAVGAFRAGQFIGDTFLITAGVTGAYTLTTGAVIGEGFISTNPTADAADVAFEDSEVIDMRLDSDDLRLEIGGLIQLGDFEFVASYSRTMWGNNTSLVSTFSLGAIFAFPDFTR